MITPTMTRMLKVYMDAAHVERLKCGRPGGGTVRNTIAGFRVFRRWLNAHREKLGLSYIGFDEDFPLVSIIKPPLIHQYLADMIKSGTKPITAMSYLNQLRQLFAKWVLPYYTDRGWRIPDFPSFGSRVTAPRYSRPPQEQLAKVKEWYQALPTTPLWFVTTMMLEFAMRNSDILRLKRENFVERNDRVFLNYMPHKTQHSSGRVVKWPIHPEIWTRIYSLMSSGTITEIDEAVFITLNKEMRRLGFTGCKGAYELRKICIDHVYQRFGIEMATSISGDNIRTITHYYADPAQPNLDDIRICDLL